MKNKIKIEVILLSKSPHLIITNFPINFLLTIFPVQGVIQNLVSLFSFNLEE